MRLLINGGCGFLGSNLSEHALNNGFELAVIDNLFRQGSEQNLKWLQGKGEFQYFKYDIKDKGKVEEVVSSFKPDAVFHLAGQVAMTTSIEDPYLDFQTNTMGTVNLLEAVRKHIPDSPVFYSSTNKVYGDLEHIKYEETETRYTTPDYPNGFDESTPLDFRSPYGCSKGAADQYMLDYARIFDLKTVVFRHSSIFGGRQFATQDQGWIGWFCQKAIEIKNGEKELFTISGNGKQVRDVLFASDLINLYFTALENIEKIKGEVFNIGGGADNSLSLLELFDLLENELGVNLNYEQLDWRQSDQKVFIADICKIKELILWQPKTDSINGIKKMLDWVGNF